MKPRSIGLFDSGVGGLTVMKQLLRILPDESLIYYADTARLPYGEKSRETIIRYSIENAIFLLEKDIKMLVVACNTATAHALEKLQHIFKVPVIGTIEPGAKHAVEVSRQGRIAVLGTKGTIKSQCYQEAILKGNPDAFVLPIACPLFVPLVEEQYFSHPATRLIVQEYLKPIKEQRIDTILLGCTHYPLLKDLIQQEVGSDIAIIDSATACAQKVASLLAEKSSTGPTYRYYVSDDPVKFQKMGQTFLGIAIDHVESVHH